LNLSAVTALGIRAEKSKRVRSVGVLFQIEDRIVLQGVKSLLIGLIRIFYGVRVVSI